MTVVSFKELQEKKALQSEQDLFLKFLNEVFLPNATQAQRREMLVAVQNDDFEKIAEMTSIAARRHFIQTMN